MIVTFTVSDTHAHLLRCMFWSCLGLRRSSLLLTRSCWACIWAVVSCTSHTGAA